ncbi:endonuclease, partial [Bacillus nitratireducens]|nr:endonuclease [Bacillus nitratireducens]
HKIEKEDTFIYSGNKDTTYWKTRKIVSATIAYNDYNITCYSCHLCWWNDEEESFKDQVDRLMERVNFNGLAFVMGDFNKDDLLEGEGYEYMM